MKKSVIIGIVAILFSVMGTVAIAGNNCPPCDCSEPITGAVMTDGVEIIETDIYEGYGIGECPNPCGDVFTNDCPTCPDCICNYRELPGDPVPMRVEETVFYPHMVGLSVGRQWIGDDHHYVDGDNDFFRLDAHYRWTFTSDGRWSLLVNGSYGDWDAPTASLKCHDYYKTGNGCYYPRIDQGEVDSDTWAITAGAGYSFGELKTVKTVYLIDEDN